MLRQSAGVVPMGLEADQEAKALVGGSGEVSKGSKGIQLWKWQGGGRLSSRRVKKWA